MIQLGPLKLNSISSEIPIGVSVPEPSPAAKKDKNRLRLNIRLHINDPTYQQLIELGRNPEISVLPLYSGYEHIDGIYSLVNIRETEVNWLWANFEIVLERASSFFLKYVDMKVRDDDWNIIYKEDFESWDGSATDTLLNEVCYSQRTVTRETSVANIGAGYFVDGDQCGYIASALVDVKAYLCGFDYWRNYSYSVWIHAADTFAHGIMWRAETGNIKGNEDDFTTDYSAPKYGGKHYRMFVDPDSNKYIIEYRDTWHYQIVNKETIYEESHTSLTADTWYHMKVITIGPYHFCYINGQMIHSFEDDRCVGGRVGAFYDNPADSALHFDLITVKEVPASLVVLDESYSHPQAEILKTRKTTYGQIAYSNDFQVEYKSGSGGPNCILHLRFDQDYGEKVFDLSAYDHHAQIKHGEWKDGYMRFSAGSDGLLVPYDSDLSNTSEGTVIIRMRRHADASSTGDAIIKRGTTDWSIFLDNTDEQIHASANQPGDIASIKSSFYPVNIDNEWRTYVLRWGKSNRFEQYIDGVSAGSDSTTTQSGAGSNTTSNMVIGQANVDIAYIAIFNQWMEYPDIPGSTSAKLLDTDSHHDDEVFDVRFCNILDERSTDIFEREYWSGGAATVSGSPQYQDYQRDVDSKPLLYRRSGMYLNSTTPEKLRYALPSHLADHLHTMDWTIEVICVAHEDAAVAARDTLVIGDATPTNKTVRIYFQTNSDPDGFHWSTLDQSAGTKSGDFYPSVNANSKSTAIMHLTYTASNRQLKYYWYGEERGSEILADDLGTSTGYVHIGGTDGTYYRVRIIASALRQRELEWIVNEYRNNPIQVFSEHEFKGYPELTNGLIATRPMVENTDHWHGEDHIVEIFDDGTFMLIQGEDDSIDKPTQIAHVLKDDSGTTHILRLFDLNPIVKHISQDEIIIQNRNQIAERNKTFAGTGLHTESTICLTAGIFAFDTDMLVTTRCSNWEMRFKHHDMQAIWREGGHIPDYETSAANARGNFMAVSGYSASMNDMDNDASIDHLMNFSIMSNLNHDRTGASSGGSWDSRDYLIGLLPEHTDDFLFVTLDNADVVIEQVHFDDLHLRIGGRFRVAMAFVPYPNHKLFTDPNASSPWSWTLGSYWTNSADSDAFNNQVLTNDGTSNDAYAYCSFDFEKGTWMSWWGVYGTLTSPRIQLRCYDGTYNKKNYKGVLYQLTGTDPQIFQDMSFVINDDPDVTVTLEFGLRDTDNASDTMYLDGICFFPCYNGADFVLDQLYAARALKSIRRFST